MRKPVVYISGKISGDKNYKRKFKRAERKLKKDGFNVFNPCCIPAIFDLWEKYMLIDLAALDCCDFIYMLKDWKDSPGAQVEYEHALEKKLYIMFE